MCLYAVEGGDCASACCRASAVFQQALQCMHPVCGVCMFGQHHMQGNTLSVQQYAPQLATGSGGNDMAIIDAACWQPSSII